MAVFANYDGITGESQDPAHRTWIDVIDVAWGMHRTHDGTNGHQRSRAVIENLTVTIRHDRAFPKLQESCLAGKVIPRLVIEHTACHDDGRVTSLRHELTDVTITSVHIAAPGEDEPGRPTVAISNRFQSIKVSYAECGSDGPETVSIDTSSAADDA